MRCDGRGSTLRDAAGAPAGRSMGAPLLINASFPLASRALGAPGRRPPRALPPVGPWTGRDPGAVRREQGGPGSIWETPAPTYLAAPTPPRPVSGTGWSPMLPAGTPKLRTLGRGRDRDGPSSGRSAVREPEQGPNAKFGSYLHPPYINLKVALFSDENRALARGPRGTGTGRDRDESGRPFAWT